MVNLWYNKGLSFDYRKLKEDNESAIKAYDQAIRLTHNDSNYTSILVSSWYNKGLSFDAMENYKPAINSYDQAINKNKGKNNDTACKSWNNKGIDLLKEGKLGESILNFTKAAEVDANYSTAYKNIGLVLLELGDYNLSLSYFNESINRSQEDWKAWYGKGIALAEKGAYKGAITSYNNAAKLENNYAGLYIGLGKVLERSGRYVDALNSFDKAIQIDPNNAAEAYYKKGDVLYELGVYNEAVTAYEMSRDSKLKISNIYIFAAFFLVYSLLLRARYKSVRFGKLTSVASILMCHKV